MITKRLLQLMVTLFLIILLMLVGLILFVDPNRYKDLIAQKVEDVIHRPFAIHGDISWRFWPRLGFTIHDIEIGTSDQEIYAQISRASTYLKIAPLLHQQIDISAINLENAKVVWQDVAKHEKVNITVHQLDTALQENGYNPLNTQLDIDMQPQNMQFSIALTGEHQANIKDKQYQAKNLKMQLHAQGIDALSMKQDIHLQLANFSADFVKNHFRMEDVYIDHIELYGIKFDATTMQVNMKDSILNISPLASNVYSGTLNGDVSMNLQKTIPTYHADATLAEAHLNGGKFTGILNMNAKLNGNGFGTKNINGTAEFHIDNGVYHGIDLGYWLAEGQALLSSVSNVQALTNVAIDAGVAITQLDKQQTAFNNLSGTMVIQNGVVHNNDLLIYNPELYATGKGTVDLNQQYLDYLLLVSSAHETSPGVYQSQGIQIPLTLTGNMKSPHVGIDKTEIKNVLVKTLGTQLKNELQQAIPDAQNAAQNPEKVVKDVLKGLLGK